MNYPSIYLYTFVGSLSCRFYLIPIHLQKVQERRPKWLVVCQVITFRGSLFLGRSITLGCSMNMYHKSYVANRMWVFPQLASLRTKHAFSWALSATQILRNRCKDWMGVSSGIKDGSYLVIQYLKFLKVQCRRLVIKDIPEFQICPLLPLNFLTCQLSFCALESIPLPNELEICLILTAMSS